MRNLLQDRESSRETRQHIGMLNHSILASLESHLAVLDEHGKIIAVNDAWLRYGHENGAASEAGIGIGNDYLDVCRPAAEQKLDNADKMYEGIQAVLQGTQTYFEIEYPCHSPTEE